MHNLDARRAKRILVTQAVCTLLVAGAATAYSLLAGFSALLGGVTATAANALFAAWVFGRYQAQEPGKLVARFYGAELLKLLFIALAFAAAFIWVKPLSVLALFGAFLVVQVLPPLLANRVAG
jgi:ATP synthase protein I